VRDAFLRDPDYPHVLFVHMGSPSEARDFFDGLWPEARAVSDPDKKIYDAFGLRRGGLGELFGPRIWWRGMRALSKGHGLGRPVGDPLVMPGAFLLRGSEVLWGYRGKDAADHPDWTDIPRILAESRR
jgi:hypothetical protein